MDACVEGRRNGALSLGLLVLRLFAGFGIAAHGWQKVFVTTPAKFAGYLESMGVPAPGTMAWVSSITELVAGVLVAAGLLTRLAAVPLAINMGVAAFVAHSGYFITNTPPGREYALNLGAVFLALVFTGAGRFSLDALCCRNRDGSAADR